MDASRVAPGLWMGGAPAAGKLLAFDRVFLCAWELPYDELGPYPFGPRARVVRVPLDDSGRPPSAGEVRLAFAASRAVARIYRTGGFRILVTCAQGRNRSGLVVALALLELGASPKDAIGAVRQARGPHALSNAWFVKLIHEAAGRRFLRFPIEASP